MTARSIEETFWLKTERRGPDECWPWLSRRSRQGYAEIEEYSTGRRRVLKASRVAWSIHHRKPFPADLFACHSCDNRICVNPAHIWPGTAADNNRDARQKGRTKRGFPPVCPRGHARGSTDYTNPRGYRSCRECQREWSREYRARQRAKGGINAVS